MITWCRLPVPDVEQERVKAYTFNDNNSKNVNITRNFAVKFQKNANESIRINRKEKVSILYPSTQLVSNVFKC